ncbi:MAG: hypothetical protein HFG42_09580 [Lachnospiraceae bacterium]|jgi:hypothetical protein|nr:hypothetical protein [Lachnospiraceae bacterium]
MKKLAVLLLSGSICLSNVFCSLANTTLTPEEAAKWEADQYKYNCDPIAKCEGKVSRKATLVASDVQKIYSGFGAYGYIWGFTEVKDGDNDAYHYTRVEGIENGVVVASQKEYGYGYVEAETEDIENSLNRNIKAKVYWGEK